MRAWALPRPLVVIFEEGDRPLVVIVEEGDRHELCVMNLECNGIGTLAVKEKAPQDSKQAHFLCSSRAQLSHLLKVNPESMTLRSYSSPHQDYKVVPLLQRYHKGPGEGPYLTNHPLLRLTETCLLFAFFPFFLFYAIS